MKNKDTKILEEAYSEMYGDESAIQEQSGPDHFDGKLVDLLGLVEIRKDANGHFQAESEVLGRDLTEDEMDLIQQCCPYALENAYKDTPIGA